MLSYTSQIIQIFNTRMFSVPNEQSDEEASVVSISWDTQSDPKIENLPGDGLENEDCFANTRCYTLPDIREDANESMEVIFESKVHSNFF